MFKLPVAEVDSLPGLGQAVIQYELVIHLAPAELLLVVVAGGRGDVPEPGLPSVTLYRPISVTLEISVLSWCLPSGVGLMESSS